MNKYRILRSDRAATGCPLAGSIVYDGYEAFGCRSDDQRMYGMEFTACSVNENGLPFFTIPKQDIEKIS